MTNTRNWRAIAATFLVAGLAALAAAPVHAEGVTRQQLDAHYGPCFVPPPFPDRFVCFYPGRGRPFPGNPDPAPSYSSLVFSASSGEFLFTVHLIRADLYAGQPCGNELSVFRAVIGYWECEHA